jgi:predicted transcriptional regulator
MSDYQDIAAALTARHLQTRYELLVGFEVKSKASDIHAKLGRAGFDFAPVTEGGRLVGRIGRQSVAGHSRLRAGDLLERLSPRFLIASNSDVGRVMTWLTEDPWLLVVDGNQVTGVVTPSDLNRQAGRTYLYLLITDFESRLANSVRRIIGPNSALKYLSEPRLSMAM